MKGNKMTDLLDQIKDSKYQDLEADILLAKAMVCLKIFMSNSEKQNPNPEGNLLVFFTETYRLILDYEERKLKREFHELKKRAEKDQTIFTQKPKENEDLN